MVDDLNVVSEIFEGQSNISFGELLPDFLIDDVQPAHRKIISLFLDDDVALNLLGEGVESEGVSH